MVNDWCNMVTWTVDKQIIWNMQLNISIIDFPILPSPFPRTHSLNSFLPWYSSFEQPCKSLIFVVSVNTSQCRQSCDELMLVWTTSYHVPLGIIGSICRKSPLSTTTFPPKGISNLSSFFCLNRSFKLRSRASKQYMCIIGASSHIISFVLIISSAKWLFGCMSHVENSSIVNGIPNLECAVRPPRYEQGRNATWSNC